MSYSIGEAREILKNRGVINSESIGTVLQFFHVEGSENPHVPNKPLPCKKKVDFDKLIEDYLSKEGATPKNLHENHQKNAKKKHKVQMH